MKAVIKYNKTEYVNIQADRLKEENGFVYVYCGDELKGIFDMSVIDMAYLSGDRDGK